MINPTMSSSLSTWETRTRWLGLVYGITFVIAGLIFVLAPDYLTVGLDRLGQILFGTPVRLLPDGPPERFWLALTTSMMANISVISFLVWRDVKRFKLLMIPLLVSKLTSSIMGLAFYFGAAHYFSHLVIFATDFPLFVVGTVFYVKIRE